MFIVSITLLGVNMKLIACSKRKLSEILYFEELYRIYRKFRGGVQDMTNNICSTQGIPPKNWPKCVKRVNTKSQKVRRVYL